MGQLVRTFPPEEKYALSAQLRRAALSVPTNIVEGYALWGFPSYLRHLRISLGSLAETEYLLIYARDSGYMERESTDAFLTTVGEVRGQLLALIKAIQAKVHKPPGP
jgi:four helix bundle protein